MVNPSTKKKVTIEFAASSRIKNQGAISLKTPTVSRAKEIVSGYPLCKRAWFEGKLIFENEQLEAIS